MPKEDFCLETHPAFMDDVINAEGEAPVEVFTSAAENELDLTEEEDEGMME